MWKEKKEKFPDGHKLVSSPSYHHGRPEDDACAAEAGVLMQLTVPCKVTIIISEQGDPFIYFGCQKTKSLVQVVSLLPVEA